MICMKPSHAKHWLPILLTVGLTAGLYLAQAQPQDALARRMAMLEIKATDAQTIAPLAQGLRDDDLLVARTAARLLLRCGKPALPALRQALQHDDMLVRRTVAMGLGALGPEAVDLLAEALKDQHVLVRQAAVFSLARIRPASQRVRELLAEAGKDEVALVRDAALNATRALFRTVDEIRLPRDGWKFKLDPERVGKDEKWFALEFDDSGWDDIGIEKAWQLFDYDYIGVAWYRRTIELPDKPKADRVELAFGGVDECAWVWLNGQYVGEHDIGPSGWDKPFRLGIANLLRWGEENQITVRAMNTAARGGIWRPVSIMVLELVR